LDPEKIIAQLEIAKKSVVADFGCGPGYFTFPLIEAVGKEGMVFAFDILPQVLESIAGKAKLAGIHNLVAKRANLEKPGSAKLEDNCADWVVLKDILFQNQEKQIIIKEAYRVLKTGGRMLVVEWNSREFGVGPSAELRVDEAKLKELLVAENFSIEKEIEAGDFHYALVARK